jgi:hypothetical protein
MTPAQQSDSRSDAKRRLLEAYRKGGLAQQPGAEEKSTSIVARAKGQLVPLSSAQQQILRRENRSAPGSLPHNECITLKTNRPLDAGLLQRCFAEIIRRHEIWRTTYNTQDGQTLQVVHEAPSVFPLQSIDLRAYPPAERETQLLQFYDEGVQQPFDLQQGPLLRAALVHLSETEQRLIVFAHLSIVDGVSVYQIFPAELSSLYDAFAAGKPSPLAEPSLQYGDFAVWQKQCQQTREAARQLEYWRRQLADGIPALRWPSPTPPQTPPTHRGVVRSFSLRPELKQALKQFSLGEGVTLFATLTACLSVLLHRYTHQERFVLGTPSLSARKRSEVHGLLGHFLNPVPLPIDLRGNPSFREFLLRVQQVIGGALAHDDVPLDQLASELQVSGPPDRDFFTVSISLQPAIPHTEWQITSMDADSRGTLWDLYLAFIETPEGLVGRAQYDADLFDDALITRTLNDLQTVMESLTGDAKQLVSTLCSQP